MSQNQSIQSIGFNKFAGGSSEVSYPCGIDYKNRQIGNSQSGNRREFQTTGCLKKHQSGMKLSNLLDNYQDALLNIVNLLLLFRGMDSEIQSHLGYLDANERKFLDHYSLIAYLIALPYTVRVWLTMAVVRVFFQKGFLTLVRSVMTQEASVCYIIYNFDCIRSIY
jgi:hypothetical protein